MQTSEGRIPTYTFHLGSYLLIKSAVQMKEGSKEKPKPATDLGVEELIQVGNFQNAMTRSSKLILLLKLLVPGACTATVFLHFQHKLMCVFSSFPLFKFQNHKLILEEHNEIRRSVTPSASNMLKMVSSVLQLA